MSRRFRLQTSHASKASAARINFNKSEPSLWGSRGYDGHGESGPRPSDSTAAPLRASIRAQAAGDSPPSPQTCSPLVRAGFSGGPTSLAQVRPGIALLVALGIEHLRTRIFRSIELQDHPLGIRNAGVRCRV